MDRLIRDTTWSRVYEGQHGSITRSKFRTDGLSVTLEHVLDNWAQWNKTEQLDFAQAFSAKASFTGGDCKILEFLMKGGSDVIASAVAIALAGCSGSQVAFDLIVSRVTQPSDVLKSNLFQALAELGDP